MKPSVAHTNIEHYLSLLADERLTAERRAKITRLVVQEVNKLGRNIEELEFVQMIASKGRRRINRLQQMLDHTTETSQRATIEHMISIFEATQQLLDAFRRDFEISMTGPTS